MLRTLFLLLIVAPICLFLLVKCCSVPKLDAHINKEMATLMASNPEYKGLSYSVEGTNVTLIGPLSNDANVRKDLLAKVGGLAFVGSIASQFSDANETSSNDNNALIEIPNFNLEKTADTFDLSGKVANEQERNRLKAYVTEGQTLKTDLNTANLPSWWSGVSDKLMQLPQRFNTLKLGMLDTTLTIEGELKQGEKSPIDYLVNNLPKGLRIDANITEAVFDEAAMACQKNLDTALANTKVFFKVGSADLSGAARKQLDGVKAIMGQCQNYAFRVEGHTDNTGSQETNRVLSQARSNSVLNYLTQNGIEASRLNAVGFGAARPVAANDTPAGRQANRRIEIVVKSK